MGQFIDLSDLAVFADIDPGKAQEMIVDAEAMATLTAPCLATITTAPPGETADALAVRLAKVAAVKAILRAAILRWDEAGTGAVASETAGPFSQTLDTRIQRRGMFWPSEIDQLQSLCASASGAFSIDTLSCGSIHQPWCSLMFGATYCSCGADIAGFPLYEY